MPAIKIQHVLSCSSEDNLHKADNLLRGDSFRKWKCSEPGEKQASIILQLEKSSSIHSLDIGNEHSAFVEVLVGKSTAEDPNEFQVLLVTSSFMNPAESKSGSNPNRVRMFGPEKLSKAVADQKWDRVKVVCTQPFNKHVQYGLSFIAIHSPPEKDEKDKPENSSIKLGNFKLKDDKPSLIKVGSFFQNRKEKEPEVPLTGAAAVRAASNVTPTPSQSTTSSATNEKPAKHKTDRPEPSAEHSSKTKTSSKGPDRSKVSGLWTTVQAPPKRRNSEERNGKKEKSSKRSAEEDGKTSQQPELKRSKSKERRHSKDDDDTEKEFSKLMSDVTIVLSGFKNPLRGEIRDKACKMGAGYKADWGPDCTHLLCAFINTPKYNQVKGKGKIVKKEWVLDSYRKKRVLPWQRYKWNEEESSSEESEEETPPPKKKRLSKESSSKRSASPEPEQRAKIPSSNNKESSASSTKPKKEEAPKKETEADPYDDSTDKESIGGDEKVRGHESSEGDTEDEIRRVQEKKKEKTKYILKAKKKDDPYDGSTDEEKESSKQPLTKKQKTQEKKKESKKADPYGESTDEEESPSKPTRRQDDRDEDPPLPQLPNFFSGKHFLLFGKFAAEERRQVRRFIIAFGGSEDSYMSESVNFVVTNSEWDGNFEQALEENASIAFVRPKWLFACNQKGKMVPYQQFIVIPES